MKSTLLSLLILILAAGSAFSQPRTNYVTLHRMNQSPSTFMSQIHFPGESGLTQTVFTFKIGYDRLTFLRNQVGANSEFVSDVEMIVDIYDKDTPQVPDRAFIERRTWRGTARTTSYEETQSSEFYIEGSLNFDLKPDRYRYIATINVNGRSSSFNIPGIQTELSGTFSAGNRRNNNRNRDLRQFIQVPDFQVESGSASLIFLASSSTDTLRAINIGSNVSYATDYSVLVGVKSGTDTYNLEVLNLGSRPTQSGGSITDSTGSVQFQVDLTNSTRLEDTNGLFLSNGDLLNDLNQTGYLYHLVTVPNSQFPNSWYQIRVKNSSTNAQIGSSTVLSRWFDIPSSLLNIDVAIDNMKFIVDENQLRELKRGNAAEKERKFRTFWEQRDPTPATEFNELMTEYYRRIDQAFEQFTTPARPGHESDQGKIYIVYGPADKVERRFPSNGSTQEVWTYADRTFIFTATSGFGDFQLVTQ